MSVTASSVEAHLRRYFKGHNASLKTWRGGPIFASHPNFYVMEFAPGPKSRLWNYVSVGSLDIRPSNDRKLEFLLCSDRSTARAVELITMAVWYHSTDGLGLGHTLPIGEAWVSGSSCDHLLISLPYPYGPKLGLIPIDGEEAHILWLLPITAAERDYKVKHGLEALEKLFDSNSIQYWLADRPSVTGGDPG